MSEPALELFKKQKIKGREEILQKILETFKKLNPISIHQFGSGIYGYRDEFSDLDLLITFKDEDIEKIIDKRLKIFESIASILVKHEAKRIAPLGGSYTLVIFETENGLFHVDFYFNRLSKTVIRTDAIHLFGDDTLPRGEWVQEKDAIEEDSLAIQIDGITFMTFIAIKGTIRRWEDNGPTFTNFIKAIYKDIERLSGKNLPPLPEKLGFPFIYAVFENISQFANPKQGYAIDRIVSYAKEVEHLYE